MHWLHIAFWTAHTGTYDPNSQSKLVIMCKSTCRSLKVDVLKRIFRTKSQHFLGEPEAGTVDFSSDVQHFKLCSHQTLSRVSL